MKRTHCLSRFALGLALLVALALFSSVPQAGDAPESGHATTVDNAAIRYWDTGGDGPVLVLVHGWSCDHTFWDSQVDGLKHDMRVITLDLPGHGVSERPEGPLTQDLMVRSVLAVMDAAGVDKAFLGGHSMGGSVIRLTALAAPERVQGLIQADGAVMPGPEGEEEIQAWMAEMQPFVEMFRGPDTDRNLVGFVESMRGTETSQELNDWVIERMLSTPAEVRLSAMEEYVRPEVFSVGPVTAPTLGVYADSPDTPPDFETMFGIMFPDSEFHMWVGPGHFLMMERPEEFNVLVRDFVARHRAG